MKNNITQLEKSFISQISSDYMPFAYKSTENFIAYLKDQYKLSNNIFGIYESDNSYDYYEFKLNLIQLYKSLLELEMESNCALIRNYPDKEFKNILCYRFINIINDFYLPFEAISQIALDEYSSVFMNDLITKTDYSFISFSPDYYNTFSKLFSESISNYSKLYNTSDIDDKIMIVTEFLNILYDLKRSILFIYEDYDIRAKSDAFTL